MGLALLLLTWPAWGETSTNRAAEIKKSEISESAKQERAAFIREYHPLHVIESNLCDFTILYTRAMQQQGVLPEGFETYVIKGKVIQVLPNGLLVKKAVPRNEGWVIEGQSKTITVWHDEIDGPIVFLKNWSKQSEVLDGSPVDVLALPVGRYQYTTPAGTQATVMEYDWGRRYDPATDHFERKLVIEGDSNRIVPVTDWDKL